MHIYKTYIYSLIVFTIVFSFLDFTTNKYYIKEYKSLTTQKKIELVSLLLFHNVIYFTLYFSLFFILYDYKKIHSRYILLYFFYVVGVIVHWKTNNNRCMFTEMTNRILKIDKSIGFRDPINILFNIQSENAGEGTLRDKIYMLIIVTSVFVSLFLYLKKIKFKF